MLQEKIDKVDLGRNAQVTKALRTERQLMEEQEAKITTNL